jgi:hypothetical protein
MLSVENKLITLSVITLNVILLSVIAPAEKLAMYAIAKRQV